MSDYSSTVRKYGDKWRVDYRYKSPVDGKVKQSCKRGFKLQREAVVWQKNELPELIKQLETRPVIVIPVELSKQDEKKNITFGELTEKYLQFVKLRKEESTFNMKSSVINKSILPFFKDKKVIDIDVEDIEEWQNIMLTSVTRFGKPYAPTTLRCASNQLSVILNYAKGRKIISCNPVLEIERIGDKNAPPKPIWTLDEYLQFRKAVEEKPSYYYAYETFFWTGLRLGEVLGLTAKNVDCDNNCIYVKQSFKQNQFGNVKTPDSIRTIHIPSDLSDKLREYKNSIYGLTDNTRLFTMSKSSLHNIKDNACKKIGLKRITIHEIRHSHISLLVNSVSCASIADIAKRAGHKKPSITLTTYTHTYNDKDIAIANELNSMMRGNENVRKEQG